MGREKKVLYEAKLFDLLDQYDKAFLFCADNVGSKQFMDIRACLRDIGGTILMGKNTLMKRCIRLYCENNKDDSWAALVPELVGNVGVLFVKDDFNKPQEIVQEFRRPSVAKVGAVAQCDVFIEAGPTSLDPSQTSFFQALGVSTKINKGSIEILSKIHIVKKGEKVGSSEATLLGKLGFKPFAYGLEITKVYDQGSFFDAAVLKITDEDIEKSAASAIQNVAALCLATGFPTLASVPHSIVNAYKENVLAFALGSNYTFPLADKVLEMLANPGAFAAAAPAGGAPAADAAPAAAPVEEEEEEEDLEFSLFD